MTKFIIKCSTKGGRYTLIARYTTAEHILAFTNNNISFH